MKKILIAAFVAMTTFAISAYSTSIITDIPLSKHQQGILKAKQQFAMDKLELLSKCKAYTNQLNIIADELIKIEDKSATIIKFIAKTKEYYMLVDVDIIKYHTIATRGMNEFEKQAMAEMYIGIYNNEVEFIVDYVKKHPTPTIGYATALVSILDKCTKKNSYI